MTEIKRISMTPIKIGGITLKNRYAAGSVTSRFLLYGNRGEYTRNGMEFEVSRARGGFGLVVTGSNYGDQTVDGFDPLNDKPSPLYAPKVSGHTFRMVTERVHHYGSKIFLQVAFGPGRMRGGKSCSRLPRLLDPSKTTDAVTKEEIRKLIDGAAELSLYGKRNGFDGIEIHAHFGYLLDQFEMACTNRRTDEYGGSLDNRLRVYRELISAIKEACGEDFPVAIRMGLKTYMKSFSEASLDGKEEFGRDIEETIEVAKKLESYGIDMFDFNAGTYESHYYCVNPYYMEKGYNIELAARVKKEVSVPVFCVGLMDDAQMCEKALEEGKIDGITVCRAAMVDTQYARKIREERLEDIRPCIQCCLCEHNNLKTGMVYCSANPAAMREYSWNVPQAEVSKRVAVIGGGIAGMVAAHTAARAGHRVDLYEKRGELGGMMRIVEQQPFKKGVKKLRIWYQRELEKLGVRIHLNAEMTADAACELEADVLLLAQGSRYRVPEIKGIRNAGNMTVAYAPQIIGKTAKVGKKIAIIGGGCCGAEIAYELKRYEGREVTLIEQKSKLLEDPGISDDVRQMLTELVNYYGTRVETEAEAVSVTEEGVVIRKGGEETLIEADTVVVAAGTEPAESFFEKLAGCGKEVFVIGSVTGERATIQAVSAQGYEIARVL